MNSRFYVYFFLLVLGLGCVNSEILPVDYPLDDPSESIVTSSIFITVVDINKEPVADAVVQLDNQFFTTDEFGTCFVQDLEMSERAYFTVEKNGFFKGSRRLYVTEGQIQYGEIVLMAKEEIGSFAAASGGLIEIDHSATVEFPNEALMLEDGTPYHGQVHVTGYAIRGDDPDLSAKMPGRLEGRNWNGDRGVLTSYGMIALEMHSPSGEKLNLKDGQKADFRMDVPEAMRSGAPAEIPMWYFDEEKGEWQLDGFAQFNGTDYESQLSHFTIWNCDDWNQSVRLKAQFVDESGEFLDNLFVRMTVVGRQASDADFTNDQGSISAFLPLDEIIKLEVSSECGHLIYSKQIGPLSIDTDLGAVTVSPPSEITSVLVGSAVDCNEKPITNGIAIIRAGDKHFIAKINPLDGSFRKTFINCNLENVSVVIFDLTTDKKSEPKFLQYAQHVEAGTLKACDVLDEFLILEFSGFTERYVCVQIKMERTYDGGVRIIVDDVLPEGMNISLALHCDTPGPCDASGIGGKIILPNGYTVYSIGINAEVTEFGLVGGYIKGTYSGIVNGGGNGQGGPGYTDYSGEFSVIRTE